MSISKRINKENRNVPGPKRCVALFGPIPASCCGPSLVIVGLCWPVLTFAGLRWRFAGLRGCRGRLVAFVGCHWPSLAVNGHGPSTAFCGSGMVVVGNGDGKISLV